MRLPVSLKRFTKKQKLIVVCSVAVIVLSVAGYISLFRTQISSTTKADVITYSTDTPDENPPGNDFKWQGDKLDPKYISLPSINAGGYLQNVGVDQNKAVAVPNNIHMAGWFVDSVRPGAMGNSIIDGHVNGRKNDGIFKNLEKLKKGDQFLVEFGDGSKKTFEVDEIVTLKTEESASVLFSQKPSIKNQLNLITCGGAFDKQLQQYSERVIAVTKAL